MTSLNPYGAKSDIADSLNKSMNKSEYFCHEPTAMELSFIIYDDSLLGTQSDILFVKSILVY